MSPRPRMTQAEFDALNGRAPSTKQRQLVRENAERWTELGEMRVELNILKETLRELPNGLQMLQEQIDAMAAQIRKLEKNA